jgi:hypothetical protein
VLQFGASPACGATTFVAPLFSIAGGGERYTLPA